MQTDRSGRKLSQIWIYKESADEIKRMKKKNETTPEIVEKMIQEYKIPRGVFTPVTEDR